VTNWRQFFVATFSVYGRTFFGASFGSSRIDSCASHYILNTPKIQSFGSWHQASRKAKSLQVKRSIPSKSGYGGLSGFHQAERKAISLLLEWVIQHLYISSLRKWLVARSTKIENPACRSDWDGIMTGGNGFEAMNHAGCQRYQSTDHSQ